MTTSAELAILSLVGERPRHGYEIEQVIERRGMRDWTEIGFSSIYYLLKKLERKGLIKGQLEEAERGPARKVYRPTPAGWEALRAGLLEALSTPQYAYPPLQLGLANLPGIPPAEAAAALRRYQSTLATSRDEVKAKWQSQSPLPYFVEAMFDYSVTMIEAEMEWIETFITILEAKDGQD
ncbi:MAG: PadR family transcriptional regulator [Anaerolineae bacterium]|nr:PadR family transcriptional regulator [Anaerolineae bacterium]